MILDLNLSFLNQFFETVEQNVWRILSSELTLKFLIVTHVELSHPHIVEKSPPTFVYSVVIQIVSCMNMGAFVCYKAY